MIVQSLDTKISRNTNAAGAPLPLIPRRANSASRTNHAKCNDLQTHINETPLSTKVSKVPFDTIATLRRHHPIIPKTPNQIRPEQVAEMTEVIRHKQPQTTNNELVQNASINASQGGDTFSHSPFVTAFTTAQTSTSRDCKEGYHSEHHIPVATQDHIHNTKQGLVRKKSGQLVKSSLKSPSSYLKADLPVMTLGKASKSEPTTPTLAKAVHFDTQLEHVKLFLSQQKPLAVSRDGSPTDDTSGTESDFPSFIYGSGNDKKARRAITMHLTNMPPSVNKSMHVALETLALTSQGSSLTGQVRLRNIAYHKILTARFTFDNWSTINEVNGRYLERIDAGFDRFVFNIRLQDLLLEGKRLIFALRYVVNGREIWDNNAGQNYIANFSRSSTNKDDEKVDHSDISDTRPKLDVSYFLNGGASEWRDRYSLRNSCGVVGLFTEPLAKFSPSPVQDGFKSVFDPLRSTLNMPSATGSKARLCDGSTALQPQGYPVYGNNIPGMPVVSLGSPRDLDCDTFRPTIRVTFDMDDVAFDTVSYTHTVRNHKRGYVDDGFQAPEVKTTLPAVSLFNSVTLLPELGSHS